MHCAREGVTLMVSVDTGIRAAAVVARAAELGIDVIITDHHLPEAASRRARRHQPESSRLPLSEKNLCGVGVAYKLVEALLGSLGWPEPKLQRVLGSFLKMVAIGTVADVVPLTGENRAIVRHGLAALKDVRSPGLRALFAVAGMTPGAAPTARQIGFQIGSAHQRRRTHGQRRTMPWNCSSRRTRIAPRPSPPNSTNTTPRAKPKKRPSRKPSSNNALATPIGDDCFALVFCAQGWHRGVLGIVASRLVDRFHRPVFVLGEEDGKATGSGRSIAGFHLLEALDAMPELFSKYGGHSHAAGLTLPAHAVEEFRSRFNRHARGILTPDHLRPAIEIDALRLHPRIDGRALRRS